MDDIVNYRFVVPLDNYTEIYFKYNYKKDYQTSDGSPFCSIDKGLLIEKENIGTFPQVLNFNIYEIRDRFSDVDEFITAFLDGDVEDDDFIK